MEPNMELTPIQRAELEKMCCTYSNLVKLNVIDEADSLQTAIDNIYTRLDEFTTVLSMVKTKNDKFVESMVDEVPIYKAETDMVSKKLDTLETVIATVRSKLDYLERDLEEAENDFGISKESKIKKIFKPFFNWNKDVARPSDGAPQVDTVTTFFEKKNS